MSVHRYETKDGTRWRVRWRDGRRQMRSRSCLSRKEAEGLDAEIKARRFRNEPLPSQAGNLTLAGAWEAWKALRLPQLAPTTQQSYEASWEAHVAGNFD